MRALAGNYSYQIRQNGVATATEQAQVSESALSVTRCAIDGLTTHQADATLDAEAKIEKISLRYASPLFRRDARYWSDRESLRGSISAVAGRNEIVLKLGRFGEIEAAGMTAFRMLILAHARERGQPRWTGRVAIIDLNTLAAQTQKHTCRIGGSSRTWIYEARMGEVEEVELDEGGRILSQRDNAGLTISLLSFEPA
jgi:hypothetical protein